MRAQLGASEFSDRAERKRERLNAEIADLQRRKDNLIAQLEVDDGTDQELRKSVQDRFAELVERLKGAQADLAEIDYVSDVADDPALLDMIPQLPIKLTELPEALQRKLFGALRLEIRYNPSGPAAIIRVTVQAKTAKALAALATSSEEAAVHDRDQAQRGSGKSASFVDPKNVPPTGFEPALPP